MELKFMKFFILCFIFCGISFEAAAKGVTCDFDWSNFYTDYSCKIKSFDLIGGDSQTVIKGAHQTNKSDNDVTFVDCWECVTAVPILDINFCQKFQQLEAIRMIWIKIEKISPQTFQNCRNLIGFELDFNKIRAISENLLTELPKLTYLSFHGNEISSIDAHAFKNQKELQVLFLSKNQLSSLPPKVFEPLINLKELLLGYNQLTIIHSDSFGIHRQLTMVDFEYNKINAIDEKFIENTAVDKLFMTENICNGDWITNKSEIKGKLKMCFDNYQPREITVDSATSATSEEQNTGTNATNGPNSSSY